MRTAVGVVLAFVAAALFVFAFGFFWNALDSSPDNEAGGAGAVIGGILFLFAGVALGLGAFSVLRSPRR